MKKKRAVAEDPLWEIESIALRIRCKLRALAWPTSQMQPDNGPSRVEVSGLGFMLDEIANDADKIERLKMQVQAS
jgi:hypothetical protein